MDGLDGRIAFITGAASGIGRDTALRLARYGCVVGLLDRNGEGASATARDVEAAGGRAHAQECDVTDRAAVDAAVAATEAAIGEADILVNSAGILRVGMLLEQSLEDFTVQFRVNVDGTFNVCQAVVPRLVARGRGSVVNVASWLGKHGMAHYGGYVATKFAVIGLTQTLALEVASSGVRVNAVCPGTIIETGMREDAEAIHLQLGMPSAEERVGNIPMGRLGLPQDVARVIAFLASDEAQYMTGQAVNVTGGLWLS